MKEGQRKKLATHAQEAPSSHTCVVNVPGVNADRFSAETHCDPGPGPGPLAAAGGPCCLPLGSAQSLECV